jgi:hypothetical protein
MAGQLDVGEAERLFVVAFLLEDHMIELNGQVLNPGKLYPQPRICRLRDVETGVLKYRSPRKY